MEGHGTFKVKDPVQMKVEGIRMSGESKLVGSEWQVVGENSHGNEAGQIGWVRQGAQKSAQWGGH